MSSSDWFIIPAIGENKNSSKPPTSDSSVKNWDFTTKKKHRKIWGKMMWIGRFNMI
jgi:hypothetical protein